MSIFNLICPRPTSNPVKPFTDTGAFQKANNVPQIKENPVDNKKVKKKKGFVGKLLSLLSSKDEDNQSNINELHPPSQPVQSQLPPRPNTKHIKEPLNVDNLKVSDYGPPRFGLSEATWTLLILSRKSVEGQLILVILFAISEHNHLLFLIYAVYL